MKMQVPVCLLMMASSAVLADSFVLKGKAYSFDPEVEIVSIEQFPEGLYVVTTDIGPNWTNIKNPEEALINYPAKVVELDFPSIAVYHVSDSNFEALVDRLMGKVIYSTVEPERVVPFEMELFNDWIEVIGFGKIKIKDYPWIYHEKFGWFYISESQAVNGLAGYWLKFKDLGWVWTLRETFPTVLWTEKGIWIELN